MPRIPTINRQSAGGINFAIGDQSQAELHVAQQQAAGTQALGQGIQRLGQGIESFNRAADAMERKAYEKTNKANAQRAAITVFDQVTNDNSLLQNGDDLVSAAQERYNQQKEEALKNAPEDMKELMASQWDEVFTKPFAQLTTEARMRKLNFITKTTETVTNSLQLTLEQDYSGESLLNSDNDTIDIFKNQLENGLISEPQYEKILKDKLKGNGVAAINGMLRDNKFKQAKQRLLKGDLSERFSVEDRQKLFNRVRAAEVQATGDFLTELNINERKQKLTLEQNQDKAFASLMGMISDGSQTPSQIRRSMNLSVQSGLVTTTKYNFLEKVLSNTQGNDDDNLSFRYTQEIMSDTKDFKTIENEIMSDVNSEKLSARVGQQLLGRLQTVKGKSSKLSDKLQSMEVKAGQTVFDDFFGRADSMEKLRGEEGVLRRSLKTLAMEKYIEAMKKNPSAPKVELARGIIRDMGGINLILGRQETAIQGLPRNAGVDELREKATEVLKQYEGKQITLKQRDDILLKIKDRMRYMQAREDAQELFRKKGQ